MTAPIDIETRVRAIAREARISFTGSTFSSFKAADAYLEKAVLRAIRDAIAATGVKEALQKGVTTVEAAQHIKGILPELLERRKAIETEMYTALAALEQLEKLP